MTFRAISGRLYLEGLRKAVMELRECEAAAADATLAEMDALDTHQVYHVGPARKCSKTSGGWHLTQETRVDHMCCRPI
jgi:hypothetical protein